MEEAGKGGRGVWIEATLTFWDKVEELDLTKGKATELLKMHEGDAVRAMRAFVKVSG